MLLCSTDVVVIFINPTIKLTKHSYIKKSSRCKGCSRSSFSSCVAPNAGNDESAAARMAQTKYRSVLQWRRALTNSICMIMNPPVTCVRFAREQWCDKKAHMDCQTWMLQRMQKAHESTEGNAICKWNSCWRECACERHGARLGDGARTLDFLSFSMWAELCFISGPNYRKEGRRGHHVSLKPSASVAK